MTITEQRVQIERVVYRSKLGMYRSAEFRVAGGGGFCCRAFIDVGVPAIETRIGLMTTEQAATLMIALQLALEWIAEESDK